MKNKVLNEWKETIAIYPRLSFKEAVELYNKMTAETDEKVKHELREKLIKGTLYVPLENIVKSGLINLKTGEYDMNDLISSSNEVWIEMIDEGKVFNYPAFANLVSTGAFIKKIAKKLELPESLIETDINPKLSEVIEEYIRFKEKHKDKSISDLYRISDDFWSNITQIDEHFDENQYLAVLIDSIYKSIKNADELSKFKLENLKTLLLYLGKMNLKEDIELVSDKSSIQNVDSEIYGEEFREIFRNLDLADFEYGVLVRRFGLYDNDPMFLHEVGKEYGKTKERIRQIEKKALRKLRHPARAKYIREYYNEGVQSCNTVLK